MNAREELEAWAREEYTLDLPEGFHRLLDTLCAEERAKALKEVWDRTQGEQMPMGFLAWLAVNAEKPR